MSITYLLSDIKPLIHNSIYLALAKKIENTGSTVFYDSLKTEAELIIYQNSNYESGDVLPSDFKRIFSHIIQYLALSLIGETSKDFQDRITYLYEKAIEDLKKLPKIVSDVEILKDKSTSCFKTFSDETLYTW